MTSRTLLVTNDFPPRPGGIQAFVHGLISCLPADDVVVYASSYDGWQKFDAAQPFRVVRYPRSMMLPTRAVAQQAATLVRDEGCRSVWFGASTPLGLLAPTLRRAGAERLVASTHGHEVGWASLPVARRVLRRIGRHVDTVTYLGEYTRRRIAPAFGSDVRMEQLAPGVDTSVFRPDVTSMRAQLGLADRPVVVCVSRLVARKGQDTLIAALPEIRRRVADTALLMVGGGKYEQRLRRLAVKAGVERDVVFTGAVAWHELPAYYAAGDVFAMPCRTRYAGMDVEGLGVVFLEAAATGLPVVAGDSGGAADAVRDGETGLVVDGRSVTAVADAVAGLLDDPERAKAMGALGRAWVETDWQWHTLATRLQSLLAPTVI
ncbi:MAG: glycosyltransferase family 4 protein [Actinomycetes bacterium]